MIDLPSTVKIIRDCEYVYGAETFFKNFGSAYEITRSQVLKLETFQTYDESGFESYDLWLKGDFEKSISALQEASKSDAELYESLKEKKVDFIRCRPVILPLSEYLKWEFIAYEINVEYGEKIFCANQSQLPELFIQTALHDFMLFDLKIAFVHDYDEQGKIKGGWIVKDETKLYQLSMIHTLIKANSSSFTIFKKEHFL